MEAPINKVKKEHFLFTFPTLVLINPTLPPSPSTNFLQPLTYPPQVHFIDEFVTKTIHSPPLTQLPKLLYPLELHKKGISLKLLLFHIFIKNIAKLQKYFAIINLIMFINKNPNSGFEYYPGGTGEPAPVHSTGTR